MSTKVSPNVDESQPRQTEKTGDPTKKKSDLQTEKTGDPEVCFSKYIKNKIDEERDLKCGYNFVNAAMYTAVKIIPFLGFFDFVKPLKTKSDITMRQLIESMHMGPPINYDGATNLINTILLLCALLLAFVAASSTVLETENFMAVDLNSCAEGFAHEATCIQIDSGGYFGTYNATGLLKPGSDYPVKPGDPVNIKDVVALTPLFAGSKPNEIPSVTVNFFSAVSVGLLLMILAFGTVWYLLLVVSGAHSMGEVMMSKFWESGVLLILVFFILLLFALLFWLGSVGRIMQTLLPHYPITGVEFGYATHSEDVFTHGQYFMAWLLESVVINTCIIVLPMVLLMVYNIFVSEWNIVKHRPTTPKEFIYYTLARLNRTHGLNTGEKYPKIKNSDGKDGEEFNCNCKEEDEEEEDKKRGPVCKKVCRCKCTEEEEGDKKKDKKRGPVGKKVCREVQHVLECFEKYGMKLDTDSSNSKSVEADSMDHFLDMWPHLDWEHDSLKPQKDETKEEITGVRQLYATALQSMYAELYPDHR